MVQRKRNLPVHRLGRNEQALTACPCQLHPFDSDVSADRVAQKRQRTDAEQRKAIARQKTEHQMPRFMNDNLQIQHHIKAQQQDSDRHQRLTGTCSFGHGFSEIISKEPPADTADDKEKQHPNVLAEINLLFF